MLEGHEEKIEELVGKVMGAREGSEGVAIGCMMSVVYYQWRCVLQYISWLYASRRSPQAPEDVGQTPRQSPTSSNSARASHAHGPI